MHTSTRPRILIISKDSLWRHICHENLAQAGFQVRSFRTVAHTPSGELAAADYVLGCRAEAEQAEVFLAELEGRGWDGPVGTIGPSGTLAKRVRGVRRFAEWEITQLRRRLGEELTRMRDQNKVRQIKDAAVQAEPARTPPLPAAAA